MLNDHRAHFGVSQDFPEFWSTVVEAAGCFRNYGVQLDAGLSSVSPDAVGLRFELRFLVLAGDSGVADSEEFFFIGYNHVPEPADAFDLEMWRESVFLEHSPCGDPV